MRAERVVGWIGLAVGTALVVVFLGFLVQVGECRDAVTPGESSCTSGPVLGAGGTTVLVTIGVAVVAFAVFRAVRAARGAGGARAER